MKFSPLAIEGAYLIEPEVAHDQRGSFARCWCREEFRAMGLDAEPSQSSLSVNPGKGTLRGMHYQVRPHPESKLVMCTRGAIHDVIVDLRPRSSSYLNWYGVELSEENRLLIYIPPDVAHGFLTLRNNSDAYYQIAGEYRPEAARGVRWDDPAFGIQWPLQPTVMSERDGAYDDYQA